MSGIVLSASVRQNLLSLQSTADLLASTQERLATGRKVQFFPGAVDRVRVYAGALTPDEVRSAYQSGQ